MHDDIPNKTSAQIRTHAQNFLIKVERVAKGIDVVEFIRSKPTTYFLSASFENYTDQSTKLARKRDWSYTPGHENNWEGEKENFAGKKAHTEVLHEPSLSWVCEHMIENHREENIIKEPVLNGKPSSDHVQEPRKVKHRDKRRLREKIPAKSPPVMKSSSNQEEEEKVQPNQFARNYPMMSAPSYAPPPQYPTVQTKLNEIMNEVRAVVHNFDMEMPNCKPLIDSDPQFHYYWDALRNCSISLQHIVADVFYIQHQTQQVQTQLMYAQPAYYPPEHPRPNYMPYYPEKPQNAEYF